jgi:hypothetical protein
MNFPKRLAADREPFEAEVDAVLKATQMELEVSAGVGVE